VNPLERRLRVIERGSRRPAPAAALGGWPALLAEMTTPTLRDLASALTDARDHGLPESEVSRAVLSVVAGRGEPDELLVRSWALLGGEGDPSADEIRLILSERSTA